MRRAGGGGTMIHPTAIIHPQAQLDPTVTVGPYAVIDGEVTLGPNCVVGPHVYLTGITQIGANNQFHAGSVIGGMPQDLKYKGKPTRLRVGDFNTFREGVTVNRATEPDEDTVIGSHNLLMACSTWGITARSGTTSSLRTGRCWRGMCRWVTGRCCRGLACCTSSYGWGRWR